MACGTGKTLTSLRIAEDLAALGGSVLFLVPSTSLLSQTLAETVVVVFNSSSASRRFASPHEKMIGPAVRYPSKS